MASPGAGIYHCLMNEEKRSTLSRPVFQYKIPACKPAYLEVKKIGMSVSFRVGVQLNFISKIRFYPDLQHGNLQLANTVMFIRACIAQPTPANTMGFNEKG